MAFTLLRRELTPADVLKSHSVPYTEGTYHVYVGSVRPAQGWLLHISVIPSQLTRLLEAILPELSFSHAAYSVIKDRVLHERLNAGHFGLSRIGKAITIYPEEETQAVTLASNLVRLTEAFDGPQIDTDFPLSNVLYTRYGSFLHFRQAESAGCPPRHYYDGKGRLIKDVPSVPPHLPDGITFPFDRQHTAHLMPPSARLLHGWYWPTQLLETTFRGHTWKAFSLRISVGPWCVLCQGKKGLQSEPGGRDVRDRFLWAWTVRKQLPASIAIPAIYDCFDHRGDTYLVTEYLPGRPLAEACRQLIKGRTWHSLPALTRKTFMAYFTQVAGILEELRRKGYVLSDVFHGEWWITPKGKVYMTNPEVLCSVRQGLPEPPFANVASAPGLPPDVIPFQTEETPHPTPSSRLAPLLLYCLTGLRNVPQSLFSTLFGEPLLEKLLRDCLETEPEQRPAIGAVRYIMENYSPQVTQPVGGLPDLDRLDDALRRGINVLSRGILSRNQKWFSHPTPLEACDGQEWPHLAYTNGLFQGSSGILYFLERAAACGVDTGSAEALVRRSLIFLCTQSLNTIPYITPALRDGSAGFGVGLGAALRAGYLPPEPCYLDAIRVCLEREATGWGVRSGVAGQGLGALICDGYLEVLLDGQEAPLAPQLRRYVSQLCTAQAGNGSWPGGPGCNDLRHVPLSFGDGMAGILCFLLQFARTYRDPQALTAAARGLDYLERNHVLQARAGQEGGWFSGMPGIALAFLKGFECLHIESWKAAAEKALRSLPPAPIQADLGLAEGLSGLGEVYLEASRLIPQNPVWKERAGAIVRLLLGLAQDGGVDGACLWQAHPDLIPTADLMVGNSGILHFLLRFRYPERLGMPLLS